MNIYATIDTNVLVSSFINHNSYPGKIIDDIYKGEIIPVMNQDILFEYINVLTREKFNFKKSDISRFINSLIKSCIFADGIKSNEIFIDEDDAIFYEVTLDVRRNKNAYLVKGNLKHFPIKRFIVNPKEFCEIVEKIKQNNLN